MNKVYFLTTIIIVIYVIGFIGIIVEPKMEGTIEINGERCIRWSLLMNICIIKL